MNPIIEKCLEELNKEQPKLDYIRGMLETALLMNGTPAPVHSVIPVIKASLPQQDEAAALDAKARAAIEAVKSMTE